MTQLIIDRAKWGRGFFGYSEGKCCALGFFVKQVPNTDLAMRRWDIMRANDLMPDGPERERRIADLFAEAGVEVVYEGVYAP